MYVQLVIQVFTALRTSQLHVPYRNSKLTQILQPSLGGDAKVSWSYILSKDISGYYYHRIFIYQIF